jgi:hypothetical protein
VNQENPKSHEEQPKADKGSNPKEVTTPSAAIVNEIPPQDTQASKLDEQKGKTKDIPKPPQKPAFRIRAWQWTKNDNKFTDWLIVILTAVIAGTSYLQWREIRSGSSDTHDLAVAAKVQSDQAASQTTLIKQYFVGSQAAILSPDIHISTIGEVTVTLQNVGHVSATSVHLHLEAWKEAIPGGDRIGPTIVHDQSAVVVPPIANQTNVSFYAKWILPWQFQQLTPLGQWPKNWPGPQTTVLSGEFTYQNGFGDKISHPFCGKWLPGFTIRVKQQTTEGGSALISCDDFLSTIHSIVENEKRAEEGNLKSVQN